MKIESEICAFITSDYKVRNFFDAVSEGNQDEAVKQLSYAGENMIGYEGWVHVGTARVSVDVLPLEAIHMGQLEALKAELQKVRAENQQRENAILNAISKLTAITYDMEAA